MLGLFTCALIVMLFLLYFILTNITLLLDTYAVSNIPTSLINLNQFFFLKVLFMYIILTLLFSFITFKSQSVNFYIIYLILLIIIILS